MSDIDAFVAEHYRFAGTLRLHRHAVGWDLVRAPANVALAPIFVTVRLFGLLLILLRLRRAGRWFLGRQILFRTDVAKVLDRALRRRFLPASKAVSDRQAQLIADYTAIRSAVAEICTSLVVLVVGFSLFRIATPGVFSLAPVLTEHAAQATAIASFPLGQRLGGLWYGVFPVDLSIGQVLAAGLGLAMLASVVTTFAGVIADPIQARLGIHRRRLRRLLVRIEADADSASLAREHLVARTADFTDIGVAVLRFFRT